MNPAEVNTGKEYMDITQKNLLLLYAIVFVILSVADVILSFGIHWLKKGSASSTQYLLRICVYIILFAFFCIGIFFMFVTIFGIINSGIKDDYWTLQLLTNVPNVYLIFQILKSIKEKNK